MLVEVANVEPAQLGDTYPSGVQQLEGCVIPQCQRVRLGGAALCGLHCSCGLFRMQHRGQRSVRPRRHQTGTRIAVHRTGTGRPGSEGASRRSTPRQRAAPVSGPVLGTQPAAQQRQIQASKIATAGVRQVAQ
jgi:hypothetical protein